MHPRAAEEIGHDGFGVGDAIGISELLGFLGFANVLATGVVESQGNSSFINNQPIGQITKNNNQPLRLSLRPEIRIPITGMANQRAKIMK